MINIKGYNITNPAEFEKLFDLEQMELRINSINCVQDIFEGFGDYDETLDALKLVLSGQDLTIKVSGEYVCWEIEDYNGHIPCSPINIPLTLSGKEAKRLLICQLGNHAYEYGTSEQDSDVETRADQIICYELADDSTEGELSCVKIWNKSLQDESFIALKSEGKVIETISLPSGCMLNILLKGEKLATIIPPVSFNASHALYCKHKDSGDVDIMEFDFSSQTTNVKRTLTGWQQQLCVDSEYGFVTLTDGRVNTYSRVVQPDSIEDMMIPSDEKIVMIAVSGAQILALTNKGVTYSNYPCAQSGKKGVLRVGVNNNGQLVAEGTQYVPTSPYTIETANGTTYKMTNGKFKKV